MDIRPRFRNLLQNIGNCFHIERVILYSVSKPKRALGSTVCILREEDQAPGGLVLEIWCEFKDCSNSVSLYITGGRAALMTQA